MSEREEGEEMKEEEGEDKHGQQEELKDLAGGTCIRTIYHPESSTPYYMRHP